MKSRIRKEILCKRTADKAKSELIKQKLLSLGEYKKARKIMAYVSFGTEVDTHSIIKEALKEKIVAVPKIKGWEMIPCRIDDFSELNFKNRYGILEPDDFKKKMDDVDLVIVPGVAFDKEGNRIGYGGGYYDTFLKNSKAKKIGIAFDMQIVDKIPAEKHDIKVDKIVTESTILL
ncbi:MAG: 5-formyltetrahydrofolate cyclo-ligase [Nanoarchaeota archaeon]